MAIIREERMGGSVCQSCGVFYNVPQYRIPKSKYCSKACRSSAIAKKHLNKGPKPWAAKNLERVRHKSTSRFKPGNEPWNKGLKGIHLSPESQFKPGRDSDRKLPFGSVTIRTDKGGNPRAWVKTVDGWIPRAQAVFLAARGSIPNGCVLHHRDGDTLNDRLGNLQPMTPAEHARVHHAS